MPRKLLIFFLAHRLYAEAGREELEPLLDNLRDEIYPLRNALLILGRRIDWVDHPENMGNDLAAEIVDMEEIQWDLME